MDCCAAANNRACTVPVDTRLGTGKSSTSTVVVVTGSLHSNKKLLSPELRRYQGFVADVSLLQLGFDVTNFNSLRFKHLNLMLYPRLTAVIACWIHTTSQKYAHPRIHGGDGTKPNGYSSGLSVEVRSLHSEVAKVQRQSPSHTPDSLAVGCRTQESVSRRRSRTVVLAATRRRIVPQHKQR